MTSEGMKALAERQRCNAHVGGKQCRCTKDLTRTLVSLFRSEYLTMKLPEKAIILLCQRHLKLTFMERLVMASPAFNRKAKAIEAEGDGKP